jgi:hypothetical protein
MKAKFFTAERLDGRLQVIFDDTFSAGEILFSDAASKPKFAPAAGIRLDADEMAHIALLISASDHPSGRERP